MTKSYKKVFLKKNRVYSVEQLKTAYDVTANTVSNWVKEGLMPSDEQKPYVFRGAVVIGFHKHQRSLRGGKLSPSQFQCRTCQAAVEPVNEAITKTRAANGRAMLQATCPVCCSKVQKITNETDYDNFQDCRNPNTPTDCLHEYNVPSRGRIGIKTVEEEPIVHSVNDRHVHRWQTYAGRYSESTIDQHLASVRLFERVVENKPFAELKTNDFAAMREELKRRANVDADDSMSASTIKHTISHLIAFFDWLLKQDGFRRVPKDFAGYLEVPKAVVARSAQVQQKQFPSLLEAEELLIAMPSKSLEDLRARAIFALAFLGALRADTLVSLRMKHVDRERRLIVQDASLVRTKAGRSINIAWFKIPKTFEAAVLEWLDRLKFFGFGDDDALFPEIKLVKPRIGTLRRNSAPVPVMRTTHAVTSAFAAACRKSEIKYTPHAAKHTIGAERDIRPLTHEERKAWSLNMGHKSEQTTDQHYGTMSVDRRFEVLERIGSKKTIDPANMSEAEKAKMFDAMLQLFGDKI